MKFNAELLKLVREQRGYSQTSFAEALNVKQAFVSKLERGSALPTDEMMMKISEVLKYPIAFFGQPDDAIPSGLVFHRKRATLAAAIRTKLEAEVKLRALGVKTIAKFLGRTSQLIPRDNRTPEEMARAIRKHWNVPAGPIFNLIELLERQGVVIIKFDFETDLLDGFWVPVDPEITCIALNSNSAFSADRHHFTLSHELGHALLHSEEFPGKEAENEANQFAGEFLMPKASVKEDLVPPITLAKLKTLKEKWRVSMASLLYRAKMVGELGDSNYNRLWAIMSEMGLRKREPDCGILFETPTLWNNMVQEVKSKKVCDLLYITPEEFQARSSIN